MCLVPWVSRLISPYLIASCCLICHFPHLCHRLFLPSPKAPATALRCLPSSGMVETWRSHRFTCNKARFANDIVLKDIEGMYIFIRPVLSLQLELDILDIKIQNDQKIKKAHTFPKNNIWHGHLISYAETILSTRQQ